MKVYSCAQMRNIEKLAFESGISYELMMENAGKACLEKIVELAFSAESRFTVICGNGNNGGDGFVIARLLKENNFDVKIVLSQGLPKTETAKIAFNKLENVEIIASLDEAKTLIEKSDIIIDCMFGIGFKGQVRGECLEIISFVNQLKKYVISVDIPSGLEGDNSKSTGEHFNSQITLAIGAQKPVHILKSNKIYCGDVYTLDIGFPENGYDICHFNVADDGFIKDKLIFRKSYSNKGTYGKLLSICGSKNMQGAAVLCANAAVKSGVGLLTCAFPEKAYCAIAPKLTEPLMFPLPDDEKGFLSEKATNELLPKIKDSTAIVIGCGLGVTVGTEKVVEFVLKNAECPIIIDADGLNIISLNIDILKAVSVPKILTPHPGEMSRLLKKSIDEIEYDRENCCKELALKTNSVVLLKGNNTVISDGKATFVNPTGNGGMAKGGSGDVLSGIISSFCAQGMSAFDSAVCGAYIHGLAGDKVSENYSQIGMTPSMLVDYLPKLFSIYEK